MNVFMDVSLEYRESTSYAVDINLDEISALSVSRSLISTHSMLSLTLYSNTYRVA